jgi:hypothetical protein
LSTYDLSVEFFALFLCLLDEDLLLAFKGCSVILCCQFFLQRFLTSSSDTSRKYASMSATRVSNNIPFKKPFYVLYGSEMIQQLVLNAVKCV